MEALASELSRSMRELGALLTSRKLLASTSDGSEARLTPTKLRALDLLSDRGGLRVGDLAAGLFVDETTATRLVDRLESMGVAARKPVAGDRRGTVVVVTLRGTRIVADVRARRAEFFRDVLQALDPEERAEFVRLTAKATAALRRELVPA